jgi:UDP-3-O-[3-hydroxymyristoyl] N-acetylglucosamine deacetylase
MPNQRTLKNVVSATGIGLHSGKKIYMSLCPASIDTGIVFRRTDIHGGAEIKACPACVTDTRLSTTLEQDGVKVSTVEHLLSAFAGLGIDNAYVNLDAAEVPIMDGSASPFVYLIKSAGIATQKKPKRYIRITKPLEVKEGDKSARLEPYNGFSINFGIDFKHPIFKSSSQQASLDFSSESFENDISRARTFGFIHEVELLRQHGLALGASLDNAVGLDEYRVLNVDGLRYDDEFVRHKILDALGDLYLLGSPLLGAFYGYKSGHALNNKLTRKVMEQRECWEYISFDAEDTSVPIRFTQPAYSM